MLENLSSSQKALVAPDIIFAILFWMMDNIVRSSIIMIDKRLILVLGGVYFVYSSGGAGYILLPRVDEPSYSHTFLILLWAYLYLRIGLLFYR